MGPINERKMELSCSMEQVDEVCADEGEDWACQGHDERRVDNSTIDDVSSPDPPDPGGDDAIKSSAPWAFVDDISTKGNDIAVRGEKEKVSSATLVEQLGDAGVPKLRGISRQDIVCLGAKSDNEVSVGGKPFKDVSGVDSGVEEGGSQYEEGSKHRNVEQLNDEEVVCETIMHEKRDIIDNSHQAERHVLEKAETTSNQVEEGEHHRVLKGDFFADEEVNGFWDQDKHYVDTECKNGSDVIFFFGEKERAGSSTTLAQELDEIGMSRLSILSKDSIGNGDHMEEFYEEGGLYPSLPDIEYHGIKDSLKHGEGNEPRIEQARGWGVVREASAQDEWGADTICQTESSVSENLATIGHRFTDRQCHYFENGVNCDDGEVRDFRNQRLHDANNDRAIGRDAVAFFGKEENAASSVTPSKQLSDLNISKPRRLDEKDVVAMDRSDDNDFDVEGFHSNLPAVDSSAGEGSEQHNESNYRHLSEQIQCQDAANETKNSMKWDREGRTQQKKNESNDSKLIGQQLGDIGLHASDLESYANEKLHSFQDQHIHHADIDRADDTDDIVVYAQRRRLEKLCGLGGNELGRARRRHFSEPRLESDSNSSGPWNEGIGSSIDDSLSISEPPIDSEDIDQGKQEDRDCREGKRPATHESSIPPETQSVQPYAALRVPQSGPADTSRHLSPLRPGAVYVRGRAAGQRPAWRNLRRALSGSLRNIFSTRSLGSTRPHEDSPHNVMDAELSPSEMPRVDGGEAPRSDLGLTLEEGLEDAEGSSGHSVVNPHSQSLVLDGVPIAFHHENRSFGIERKATNSSKAPSRVCACSRRGRTILVAVIIILVVAVIFGVVLVRGNDKAVSSTKSSGAYSFIMPILQQFTSPDDLNNYHSPQGRAFLWLADDLSDADFETLGKPSILQRYALATIFFATGGQYNKTEVGGNNTDNASKGWNNMFNFLSAHHECSWNVNGSFRLHEGAPNKSGVTCSENEPVVNSLCIQNNNLTGSIPSEIGLLRSLEQLDVVNNQIGGSIPSHLGDLVEIRSLILTGNRFSGKLPSSLGRLTKAHTIMLGRNKLSSSVPTVLMMNLTALQVLSLGSNKFDGTFPFEQCSSKQQMRILDLNKNDFSGVIPESIRDFEKLEYLSLGSNSFNGTVPPVFNLPNLTSLDLGGNNLSGSLPFHTLNKSVIEELKLSGNKFKGSIPTSICDFRRLEKLELKGNNLTGTIPPVIDFLVRLTWLDLSNNTFKGKIPEGMSDLTALGYLDLSVNELTGTIPTSLAESTSLYFLSLSRNNFRGDISFLCKNEYKWLKADCLKGKEKYPEVICTCCNLCCRDGDFGGPIDGCYSRGP